MRGRLVTILSAICAAAIVSITIVVFTGAGSAGGEKQVNDQALAPADVIKLPSGTPVPADIPAPINYGPFRILPVGSVPHVCGTPKPSGTEQKRVESRDFTTVEEARDHNLFVAPKQVPDGWSVTDVHTETVTWDDDSTIDSIFNINYSNPHAFNLRVYRVLEPDGCPIEIVNPSKADHALTLGTINGLPAIFQHQQPGKTIQALMQISFVTDNVWTTVEGTAIDLEKLTGVAKGLATQIGGSQ